MLDVVGTSVLLVKIAVADQLGLDLTKAPDFGRIDTAGLGVEVQLGLAEELGHRVGELLLLLEDVIGDPFLDVALDVDGASDFVQFFG